MQGEDGVGVPVKVLVDSQPALDIVHNPVYHARTKQILARYHFVRDGVFQEKELYFVKISAGQMGADMMTKHARVGVVRYHKKFIGMMEVFVMRVVQFHHVMQDFSSFLAFFITCFI